jgi:hypothetical protein
MEGISDPFAQKIPVLFAIFRLRGTWCEFVGETFIFFNAP